MNELQIINVRGIDCYEQNGVAYLRLETCARGLGFTQEKNGVEYVKWERVNGYLRELGFSPEVGKDAFIPENVFYRLAMKAKNEVAEKFQAKIADEVIPSIRKTGGYIAGQDTMTDTELMAKALLVAQRTIDERNRQLRAKEEHIAILQEQAELAAPKVLFAEAVSASKGTILVRELAVLLKQNGVDIGQNRLYKFLRENGYLIKRSGSDWNMPTQYSMEHGWFEVKERTVVQPEGAPRLTKTPVVTTHGQEYFIDLFLKKQRTNRRAGGQK